MQRAEAGTVASVKPEDIIELKKYGPSQICNSLSQWAIANLF